MTLNQYPAPETLQAMGPLAHCNVDEANQHLRQGTANKAHALAYVAAWNGSGKHCYTAEVSERLVNCGGCACLAPFIRLI